MNRYYSSGLGRFFTVDPYRANSGGPGDASDPGSWNRFSYVEGDPTNYRDSAGLQAEAPHVICVYVDGQLDGCEWVDPLGTVSSGGFMDITLWWTDEGPIGVNSEGMPVYSVTSRPQAKPRPLLGTMPSPLSGDPNTFFILPRGLGPTIRVFGPNGGASFDLDYHSNHPEIGNPHVHRYEWGARSRVPEPVDPRNVPTRPVVPPGSQGPYSPWPRQPTRTIPPSVVAIGVRVPLPIMINPCVLLLGRLVAGCGDSTIY